MDQFVCVRLIRAENLDRSIFRFDPDLSFAVFLMNADKTVYGRFGSRSDFYEAERDINTTGFSKALTKALELHKDKQKHAQALAGKRPAETRYKTFTDFLTQQRSTQRSRGRGRGRCTHCHELRTAEQLSYRLEGKPVPESVMFSWPMPDAAGLHLDPNEMATVKSVWEDSAGFKKGDRIETLNGQPMLSIADVQWVLQTAANDDTLKAVVTRDGSSKSIDWKLPAGWRRYNDISWRTTTDILRRNYMNRVEFDDLTSEERKTHGLSTSVIALKAARGVSRTSDTPIKRDDIVIAVDGKDRYMSEGDLIAYILQQKSESKVAVKVIRNGKKIDVEVPVR